MFYQESLDPALRLGDVLRGFVITTPSISDPTELKIYNVEINHPEYCVILSPCCSIGDKVIVLSPLIPIRNTFLSNPFFEEDMTRINREMQAQEAVAPIVWERIGEDEKQKRIREGKQYAFSELFIFDQNPLFKKYELNVKGRGKMETGYYRIDFRNIHKVNCDRIVTNSESPLELKCFQLSKDTRSELREKLAYYFARVPEEDKIQED
jgi:hypothetical protein